MTKGQGSYTRVLFKRERALCKADEYRQALRDHVRAQRGWGAIELKMKERKAAQQVS